MVDFVLSWFISFTVCS